MSFDIWFLFFLSYLVVTLSPGPNVLLVVKNSLSENKTSTLITIFGNLFCQLLIVIMVAFGIGEILEQTPTLFILLKIIGGLYLIYLGIKSFKSSSKIKLEENRRVIKSKKTFYFIFKESFLVSASNPKTIVFLSAFLPQFVSADSSLFIQFFIMFITLSSIVLIVHIFYAYLSHKIKKYFHCFNIKNILSKVVGITFISMGGVVLLSNNK